MTQTTMTLDELAEHIVKTTGARGCLIVVIHEDVTEEAILCRHISDVVDGLKHLLASARGVIEASGCGCPSCEGAKSKVGNAHLILNPEDQPAGTKH